MHTTKLATGAALLALAGQASAGTRVGITVGATVGNLVGQTFGDAMPLAGSSVLLLGAVMLGVGVYIVRRKRR